MAKHNNLEVLYKQGSEGASYFSRNQLYMDQLFENDKASFTNVTSQKAYDFKDYQDLGLKLVDTTGAGDSFTGAFAVAILLGLDTKAALDYACKVAFLTVSRKGAIKGRSRIDFRKTPPSRLTSL
jgi:sugar/nucleoside kinase (ribokinase family)